MDYYVPRGIRSNLLCTFLHSHELHVIIPDKPFGG